MLQDIVDDQEAWKLVMPKDHQPKILHEVLGIPKAGHLGIEKT